MRSCQAKACGGVIEPGALPLIQSVAGLAVGARICRAMIKRRCGLVVDRVTRDTLRAHPCESSTGGAAVTGFAVSHGVRPYERKPVRMPLSRFDLNTPAAYGMAVLAGRSKLSPVNVCVAGRARSADVREHRFHMTIHAGHGLMLAEKREACLNTVIEVRKAPNGLP
jgi:hypothetical protein